MKDFMRPLGALAATGRAFERNCPRCGHLTGGTREGDTEHCTTCGGVLGPATTPGNLTPLRAIDRPPPPGYRVMTVRDFDGIQWGNRVYLWDGTDLHYGAVHSFVEDAVNIKLVRSGHIVPLELWNPDMEDGPSYPPRDRELTLVAVTLNPA